MRRIAGMGVIAALAVTAMLGAGCQSPQVSELEKQNYLVRQQYDEVQGALKDCRAELAELRSTSAADTANKEQRIQDLQQKNAALVNNLKQLQGQYDEALATPVGSIVPPQVAEELQQVSQSLGGDVFSLDGNVLRFKSDILFASGKAELQSQPEKVLAAVANVLNSPDAQGLYLRVDGHTDNQPIKYSSYKDNWELSAERARNVLLALQKNGIDPHRMYLAGFGEYYPRASNSTAEGRKLNRRVDILLMLQPPAVGTAAETGK